MKMSIVVGCSRVHAGSHPLNMNIGPSRCIDSLIICIVDLLSAPDALMIRLCSRLPVSSESHTSQYNDTMGRGVSLKVSGTHLKDVRGRAHRRRDGAGGEARGRV